MQGSKENKYVSWRVILPMIQPNRMKGEIRTKSYLTLFQIRQPMEKVSRGISENHDGCSRIEVR
ncbi:hypothetical protein MKX03_028555 [Papaver bracteatum]|nr:hypothetical protein MKX03_028555 [Papaver bracteatum]